MEHFEVLEAMGVRVLPCPSFETDAAFVAAYSVLIVDADLGPEKCEEVTCRVLGALADSLGS